MYSRRKFLPKAEDKRHGRTSNPNTEKDIHHAPCAQFSTVFSGLIHEDPLTTDIHTVSSDSGYISV